jgi:hypothetical protein
VHPGRRWLGLTASAYRSDGLGPIIFMHCGPKRRTIPMLDKTDPEALYRTVAGEPSGIGQQRGEPLHPLVDSHVVDLDPAFGEQFLDVAVRQPVVQVPTDRHHDHLGRKAEPGERRAGRRPGTRPSCGLHRNTLPDLRSADATEPVCAQPVRNARAASLRGPAGQDRRNIRKLVASDGGAVLSTQRLTGLRTAI